MPEKVTNQPLERVLIVGRDIGHLLAIAEAFVPHLVDQLRGARMTLNLPTILDEAAVEYTFRDISGTWTIARFNTLITVGVPPALAKARFELALLPSGKAYYL